MFYRSSKNASAAALHWWIVLFVCFFLFFFRLYSKVYIVDHVHFIARVCVNTYVTYD